eukprot:TRINITY_DN6125_c0_g1_i1.p1 TRINITY_DN6125_c0_g1~~TRINITY_DN6125_c0_g1_i1.p1  ORF type:complete len:808 (+),score=165.98 TRINITY_DN6125_c0_g1_i1:167-2590(+)
MVLIAGASAAVGGAATAVGAGAFKYNRANYLFDAGLRFARYNAGYGYAMGQTAQYREDIRDLTALTTAKQDTYHVVGVIFFVLNFQLIMAGRLGVHGPSPPGWLLGIYWVNIASALMFLCTFTWLTMHASARATAGSVNLLTRTVRLPIPTPKQLDKARRTGNSFEKQRVSDVFRVPFVVPAPKEVVPEHSKDDAKDSKPSGKEPGKRRMPKWYQDEQTELHGGKGQAKPLPGSPPEHFELYRNLQQEWSVHDCYARIGLLYFMSHWMTSISLYSQCHVFTELRNIWPAWTVSIIFSTAHWTLLNLDIAQESHSRLLANTKVENFLPFTPMICVLGMSLDYSTLTPGDGWIAAIYALSWIAYIIHFVWALRLFELAMPHPQAEQAEVAGTFWYPAEWWLPRAFANSVYIVAPPKALEPGQSDILQEMKAGKGSKNGAAVPSKKARQIEPMLFPWKLFRGAIITNITLWCLIIFGRAFEQVNGERQLLKQEGRVMRWPSHMQPWMTPWTREGTRNEFAHTGGSDRRLQEVDRDVGRQQQKLAAMAQRLAASLGPLAQELDSPPASLPAPLRAAVAWPAELKPSLLASKGDSVVAALSRDHRGALLHVPEDAATITSEFVLQGTEHLGELLAAAWGSAGLVVTSKSGAMAECVGLPVEGVWPCTQLGHRLPLGGSSVKAAVVTRVPRTGLLRAAVTFTGEEGVILLDADAAGEDWTAAGEIQSSHSLGGSQYHFAFSTSGEELIVSTHQGHALKWNIAGAETEPVAAASPQSSGQVWHSACGCGQGRVAHLASATAGASAPELFISRSM